jgi:hypothetical protein
VPRRAVSRERISLSTRPIEREHLLSDEPLARRVPARQKLELRHQSRMPTPSQLCVDLVLGRLQPKFCSSATST